jgi:hypothetical protein
VLHREFRARRAWDELAPVLRRPATLRPAHLRHVSSIAKTVVALPLLRLELDRRARAPHEGLKNLVVVTPES